MIALTEAQPHAHADASVLQSVRAEGSIKGLLFELMVEQHYLNAGAGNIEAVYTFPVPWQAVLLGVECVLGDKVLQGTIAAKADGERAYEDALEDGDTAVMVERVGDGMYSVNVGNLLPGERALIRFRYAQLLSFAQGQVRLVVPTVIGPRYGNPGAAGLQPHQAPATDLRADYPFALSITLHGEMADATLSSPTHPVAVRRVDAGLSVSLGGDARLDRDFVLLAEGLAGRSLSTAGRDGDAWVALASFCPQAAEAPPAQPLKLKILVDCSGSMNGDRIDAARRALREVLANLEPADRFSFSRFGSDVAHLSASLTPATARAVIAASGWVAATQADMGGTEIREALESVFALAQPENADVLLITDGDVWEAEELVAHAVRAGQRIFAIGIGSAPASSLLHALAGKTGGACELVAAHTEIENAILRMFRRMRQAPVLEVAVNWDGEPAWQTAPGKLVLGGETQHHFAGFAAALPSGATLSWQAGAGAAPQRARAALDKAADENESDTLARVAAACRMAEAPASERHALALRYGLVSATTNLILVHQREGLEKPAGLPELRTVAQSLPAGWGGLGHLRASVHAAPAMWRRDQASASVQVCQNLSSYDVPAMMRRATENAGAWLYRDALRGFLDTAGTPVSLDEVAARLPAPVVDGLRALVEDGYLEAEVLRAFMIVLTRQFRDDGVAGSLRRLVRRFGGREDRIADHMLELRVVKLVREAFDARDSDAPPPIPAWLRRRAD
jgi:Ca-activated chloride channel family protein